eukprot:6676934-Lingulodinium_polyedra.AAC.1
MKPTGPVGHLLIEVDDIASQGTEDHGERMKKLRSRFKFGKWRSIYGDEREYRATGTGLLLQGAPGQ